MADDVANAFPNPPVPVDRRCSGSRDGSLALTATFGFPLARAFTAVLGLFILILGVLGIEMYLFSRNLWFGKKGTRPDGTADRLGRPR